MFDRVLNICPWLSILKSASSLLQFQPSNFKPQENQLKTGKSNVTLYFAIIRYFGRFYKPHFFYTAWSVVSVLHQCWYNFLHHSWSFLVKKLKIALLGFHFFCLFELNLTKSLGANKRQDYDKLVLHEKKQLTQWPLTFV